MIKKMDILMCCHMILFQVSLYSILIPGVCEFFFILYDITVHCCDSALLYIRTQCIKPVLLFFAVSHYYELAQI